MKRLDLTLCAAMLLAVAGCSGTDTTASSASSAIKTVLANSASDHAQATQCFTDFDTCLAAAATSAAIDACRVTLKGCLPARPDAPLGPGACCDGDHQGGGDHRGGGPGGGGHERHPGDGGMRPDDDDADGGEEHHGIRSDGGMDGPSMHCGLGGPAAEACKVALDACLADTKADKAVCIKTAHTCVHDAIATNFKAACADRLAHCQQCATNASDCDALAAVCAAGVTFPDVP